MHVPRVKKAGMARAPECNRGRLKLEQATRCVTHAAEQCSQCGEHLAGGSIVRSVRVIESAPVAPLEITEHRIIRRRCPLCGKRVMPEAVESADETVWQEGQDATGWMESHKKGSRRLLPSFRYLLRRHKQVGIAKRRASRPGTDRHHVAAFRQWLQSSQGCWLLSLLFAALVVATAAAISISSSPVRTHTRSVPRDVRHASLLPGNPEGTTYGVHLAQGSMAGIIPCCHSLLAINPPHRLIWNWNSGESALYPMIYKGHYFPADRQPDTLYTPAAKPLSWFQAHHPDWIEYRCNRTRVAYEFGETTYLPLDIANPAVLTWEEQHFWGPTAASGRYQMLAFDNFQLTNDGGYSGQRCGHYATITTVTSNPSPTTLEVATAHGIRAGTWIALSSVRTAGKEDIVQVRRVSGTSLTVSALTHVYANGDWVGMWRQQYQARDNDPAYRRDEIALAATIRSWLRGIAPHVAFSGNVSWNPSYPADSSRLISTVDLWWDEDGFTNDGRAPYAITDSSWRAKAAGLSAFLASARHGWVDGAAIEHDSASWTTAEVNWFLGNYLLFKNDASWLFPHGPDQGATIATSSLLATAAKIGAPTDTYYQIQGVYWRDYTHGLVLVNPSSRISRMILLGALHYRDLWGVGHQGVITLGPAQAVVLLGPRL